MPGEQDGVGLVGGEAGETGAVAVDEPGAAVAAGLAVDRDAGGGQGLEVAVDGPDRHLQLASEGSERSSTPGPGGGGGAGPDGWRARCRGYRQTLTVTGRVRADDSIHDRRGPSSRRRPPRPTPCSAAGSRRRAWRCWRRSGATARPASARSSRACATGELWLGMMGGSTKSLDLAARPALLPAQRHRGQERRRRRRQAVGPRRRRHRRGRAPPLRAAWCKDESGQDIEAMPSAASTCSGFDLTGASAIQLGDDGAAPPHHGVDPRRPRSASSSATESLPIHSRVSGTRFPRR